MGFYSQSYMFILRILRYILEEQWKNVKLVVVFSVAKVAILTLEGIRVIVNTSEIETILLLQ